MLFVCLSRFCITPPTFDMCCRKRPVAISKLLELEPTGSDSTRLGSVSRRKVNGPLTVCVLFRRLDSSPGKLGHVCPFGPALRLDSVPPPSSPVHRDKFDSGRKSLPSAHESKPTVSAGSSMSADERSRPTGQTHPSRVALRLCPPHRSTQLPERPIHRRRSLAGTRITCALIGQRQFYSAGPGGLFLELTPAPCWRTWRT